MKNNNFSPKSYLEKTITENKCDHLIVSRSAFDDGMHGNFYNCLVCGKHIKLPYNKKLDMTFRYEILTVGTLTNYKITIFIDILSLICRRYINESNIDIVNILKAIDPSIEKILYKLDTPTECEKRALKKKYTDLLK